MARFQSVVYKPNLLSAGALSPKSSNERTTYMSHYGRSFIRADSLPAAFRGGMSPHQQASGRHEERIVHPQQVHFPHPQYHRKVSLESDPFNPPFALRKRHAPRLGRSEQLGMVGGVSLEDLYSAGQISTLDYNQQLLKSLKGSASKLQEPTPFIGLEQQMQNVAGMGRGSDY
eukprot:TRINITY_DN62629_c0_g1_i1.p1 TRINITY_DN62629_c0_g1~~TRINITY_DN62629_c0_g1_i1.p1  ORF type:complete len:173 (+),score=16.47 TRINITY_DN62629_c0_g1_i1:36-554(+)